MQRIPSLGHGGRLLLALAVAGAAFGIATAVQAAIPDASGVIHGCYSANGSKQTNGTALNIIDSASASCGKSMQAIPWNQRGPTGSAGTNGTNGKDGKNGATGPAGPTGQNGTNGTPGATGATGPTGQNGTDGKDGARGPSGPTGATGPSDAWVDVVSGTVPGPGVAADLTGGPTLAAGNYVVNGTFTAGPLPAGSATVQLECLIAKRSDNIIKTVATYMTLTPTQGDSSTVAGTVTLPPPGPFPINLSCLEVEGSVAVPVSGVFDVIKVGTLGS
jgi:hypothetical protein